MRTETIAETIEVRWRDERKGRATVSAQTDLETLLDHYGLPAAYALPFRVEQEHFTAHSADGGFPCNVVIERKPQGPVQAAAWTYAKESGMARIEMEGEVLGVRFLDEDRFVPFSHLRFDPVHGFQIIEGEA